MGLKFKVWVAVTRIILRPLSALSLDEVNIAKRNIMTGLFGLGSLMLNSLHLKRSEDCNLNLITVGKLNTEVNSYVPF